MKIGELTKATGLTAKTIRYYELLGLINSPRRSESGYRLYSADDVERLEFVVKAKQLGLSLEEIRDVIDLRQQQQTPCVHVLALLDQKLNQLDAVIKGLAEFRRELGQLQDGSATRLAELGDDARICGIIEQKSHARGEQALTWLEFRRKKKDIMTPGPPILDERASRAIDSDLDGRVQTAIRTL